jgi:hypothetical protein
MTSPVLSGAVRDDAGRGAQRQNAPATPPVRLIICGTHLFPRAVDPACQPQHGKEIYLACREIKAIFTELLPGT